MIIYCYSKCSTCKNALRFIESLHMPVVKKEITETPPSLEELEAMLQYQQGSLRKLFNTSGNLYRELNLSEKLDQMPLKEALELLTQHGMLVKRPFLIGKDFGIVGFNESEWSKRLS